MAHPYLIDPDETFEVSVFIDNRNGGFAVLYDDAIYRPATGDNNSLLSFRQNGELPAGVVKETARFVRPSFAVQRLIDTETLIYEQEGRIRRNFVKYAEYRVKYLMRDWTLGEKEPSLKLKTIKEAGKTVLDGPSVKTVLERTHPDIVQVLLDSLDLRAKIGDQSVEQKAIEQLKEQTGIEAKN